MTKEQSNTLELALEGTKNIGVSSAEHAIDKFTLEATPVVDEEYELPASYGVDTLKCMSVNVNTIYVYWEITESLLEKFSSKGKALLLKLVSEDEDGSELMNFFITDMVSSRFVNVHIPDRKIRVVIGTIIDGNFIEMISSNKFLTPSNDITLSTDELWMSESEYAQEILKASSSSGFNQSSSFGIVKELEFLKRRNDILKTSESSSSFTLSKKE